MKFRTKPPPFIQAVVTAIIFQTRHKTKPTDKKRKK